VKYKISLNDIVILGHQKLRLLLTYILPPKAAWLSIRDAAHSLTGSQGSYLIAFVALMISATSTPESPDLVLGVDVEPGGDDEGTDPDYVWVGLLAGLALSRELLDLFHRAWESTVGKALFLVIYAATANFALAVAALKVNIVAGIEPSPLVFNTGFTTLLMLPFWLVSSTIAYSTIALVVINLWLIICLALRLIRVKIKVHWKEKRFAITTMILRIVLIPIFIGAMFKIVDVYIKQINLFNESSSLSFNFDDEKGLHISEDYRGPENSSAEKESINDENDTDEVEQTVTVEQTPNEVPSEKELSQAKEEDVSKWTNLDKAIAFFIFYFENFES